MKNKKSSSRPLSSYSFLSPLSWSIKNGDKKGILLSISTWFVSLAFIFFITYFAWFIEQIPLKDVRVYIYSGRFIPILIIIMSLSSRVYAFNRSKKEFAISRPRLYYLRVVMFVKYLLLLLTVPFINSLTSQIDSKILDGLTTLSQQDVLDLILKFLGGQ